MIDLERETQHFAMGMVEHVDRLVAYGISTETIAQLGSYAPLGVGPISILPGQLFEPSDEGEIHVVLAVWEGNGIVDLVAFKPTNPTRWYWRVGQGWCLSPEQICRPTFDMAPLQIWDTPLSWLQNGCRGICILDYEAQEVSQLFLAPEIETDAVTARYVRLALSKPKPLPGIVIRKLRSSAA
ncbi:hypothetical protein [Sphingobium phenoxybenzoativorans]|uniref:hypothetical protein n=1 Tax=Sphingobium phenoxybenzoativorans TaxID=1592790 RepID=UPI001112EBDC|nr:hypothetical protein [Sphingobium phenoxybenzoativorans]